MKADHSESHHQQVKDRQANQVVVATKVASNRHPTGTQQTPQIGPKDAPKLQTDPKTHQSNTHLDRDSEDASRSISRPRRLVDLGEDEDLPSELLLQTDYY